MLQKVRVHATKFYFYILSFSLHVAWNIVSYCGGNFLSYKSIIKSTTYIFEMCQVLILIVAVVNFNIATKRLMGNFISDVRTLVALKLVTCCCKIIGQYSCWCLGLESWDCWKGWLDQGIAIVVFTTCTHVVFMI